MRKCVRFGTILFSALFLSTFAIPSLSGEERTFTEADEEEAYALSMDLDGDGVRERFAIEGNEMFIFKKDASGTWSRRNLVVADVAKSFGEFLPRAVMGVSPPGESIPREIRLIGNGPNKPVEIFRNPFYKKPPRSRFARNA